MSLLKKTNFYYWELERELARSDIHRLRNRIGSVDTHRLVHTSTCWAIESDRVQLRGQRVGISIRLVRTVSGAPCIVLRQV